MPTTRRRRRESGNGKDRDNVTSRLHSLEILKDIELRRQALSASRLASACRRRLNTKKAVYGKRFRCLPAPIRRVAPDVTPSVRPSVRSSVRPTLQKAISSPHDTSQIISKGSPSVAVSSHADQVPTVPESTSSSPTPGTERPAHRLSHQLNTQTANEERGTHEDTWGLFSPTIKEGPGCRTLLACTNTEGDDLLLDDSIFA